MDIEEKYQHALNALRQIAKFGHAENCMSHAPVHECGCYDADETEIAKTCLQELDEEQ